MKQNIAKISSLSAAMCLLALLAASCINADIIKEITDGDYKYSFEYANPDRYNVGSFSTTDSVLDIDIDWINGTIEILPSDNDSLSVSETANRTLTDTTTLHWYLDSVSSLHIVYAKSLNISSSKIFNNLNKHLVVRVPRNTRLNKVRVNGVELNLSISQLQCEDLDINGVDVILKTHLAKVSNEVDIDGVDINVDASFNQAPHAIIFNGVDMKGDISLPSDTRVSAESDGVKCKVKSKLPKNIDSQSVCEISVDGVSGCINVLPLTK